ncbi:hypothetical protein A6V39_00465 [Candidatus Mycoplasma haematobovis]|uniref:Uncharacterized protein n=1 Tax=Candidatus Mycoplasma haematobovis TaxID=432608 RepID=A0A1A9QDH7_9MOLU|nr:hypothetical protein [Candidatus Mycoplasma haematobovis]OAL10523.1 hypothetical protein A6V39_00465 [Candidatus Mycoplasma haematobovis]
MLSTGKLITGVAAVGVTGGVGVGSFFLLNKSKQEPKKKKISELLTGKTLITTQNKTGATKAWNKYKTDETKQQEGNIWKLSDWSALSDKNSVPESLVTLCNLRKDDEVSGTSDSAYTNFVDWCTIETAN